MNSENYHWYKSHGICVSCGRQDAVKGVYCLLCSDRHLDSYRKWKANNPPTAEQKANDCERRRRIREERRAAGLCTVCGRPVLAKGRAQCHICREKNNRYRRNRHIERGGIPAELRGDGTYCYMCCKPLCNGEYHCSECKQKLAKNAKIARAYVDYENHRWKRSYEQSKSKMFF